MSHSRSTLFAVAVVFAFLTANLRAVESPEQAKRAEFTKAYGTATDAGGRKAALSTLAGCEERASRQALFNEEGRRGSEKGRPEIAPSQVRFNTGRNL